MGAVRMTTRGKYVKESAQRYLDYKKFIYYSVLQQINNVYNPIDAAIGVEVVFKMPIPESWSIKQKQEAVGSPHTKKPDIDNLLKGLFDAVNGLLWIDDNRIARLITSKIYSNEPGIELIIEPIGGLSHGQAKAEGKTKTQQRAARKAKSRAGRNIRARI
jgi:Holliday junction resolvase RusA-like endonuclease